MYRLTNYRCVIRAQAANQRGVSLVELLVGITLGLLTIAVAMGALIASRGVSGAVSDTTQMQQQAAHAFHILSRQIRQAGSLHLDMGADAASPVALTLKSGDFDNANAVRGLDDPASGQYTLTVAYGPGPEPLYPTGAEGHLVTDCLGKSPSNGLVTSAFVLFVDSRDPSKRELRCKGTTTTQPIVQNVAEFKVRYLLQSDGTMAGDPLIGYVTATNVKGQWANVTAVKVCLALYGNEPVDMPEGTTYIGCDGHAVDITKLAAPRNKRTHLVFRNVYQLRSHGVSGGK